MKYQYTSKGFERDYYSTKNQYSAVTLIIIINVFIFLITGNNNSIINQIFGLNSNL